MIKISDDVIRGLVASHNERDDEEERMWCNELWDKITNDNPGILHICQSYANKSRIENEEFENGEDSDIVENRIEGFLLGATLIYAAFQRHFESEEFERNFA